MSAKTKIRKGETQKAPFSRHVEIFLEMMAAERGASANTIEAYNRDLHNFGLFMHRRREKIEDADTKRIKQYLSKLYDERRAPATRARHLSVLRQFFAFLLAEGLKDYDPTQHISSPKKGRVLPKVLNKREVEKLLLEVAEEDSRTLKDPEAKVIFRAFGASSLDFELAAWTKEMSTQPTSYISGINFAIEEKLREHDIEIPFPQQDLHIRSSGFEIKKAEETKSSSE